MCSMHPRFSTFLLLLIIKLHVNCKVSGLLIYRRVNVVMSVLSVVRLYVISTMKLPIRLLANVIGSTHMSSISHESIHE